MLTLSLFSWLRDFLLLMLKKLLDTSGHVLCKHYELQFCVFVCLLGVRECCLRDKLSVFNYVLF